MNKLLSLGMVSFSLGRIAVTLFGSQGQAGNEDMRDRFAGPWLLAWLKEEGADGKIHRADCIGLFVYTRDRHMSVQVMYRSAPAETSAALVQYAQGATKHLLARMRLMNALTPLLFTSREHWCGR